MNTRTIKGKSLGILLSLALVLSLVAVAIPVEPVQANANSITIQSPSSSNITYAKTGGWVNVYYDLTGSGTTDIGILVNSATLGTAGNSGTLTKTIGEPQYFTPVLITGNTEGTYNVQISCSENATAGTTNTNAVVLDNTAPIVSISIPSSTTCWMGGSTQNIQWAATDAAGSGNVTIKA